MHSETTLFAADMHLHPSEQPEQNSRLRHFLEYATEHASQLVLLGDVFNFWYEQNGRVIGDYGDVLGAFRDASERGLAIHHVIGNRDFVLGASPEMPGGIFLDGIPSALNQSGFILHGLRYVFQQDGKVVHCLHGDTFCTDDIRYQALRALLQGALGRIAGMATPFFLIKKLIQWAQRLPDKPHTSERPRYQRIVDSAVACEIDNGADAVLCGHVHYHERRTITARTRTGELIVVPPWGETDQFGIMENGNILIKEL